VVLHSSFKLNTQFLTAEETVPCLGFVMREAEPATGMSADEDVNSELALRKVVVLGDTRSPEPIIPLITSSPGRVSILIHEATDCYIPPAVDPEGFTGRNRTIESVQRVSLERGHSTPTMAGHFAKLIGAEQLYLNHIGGR
jgi:ribonuclease Z